MVFKNDFKKKSFLVYGLGLTGQSVIKFFKKNRIKRYKVWDDKNKNLYKSKRPDNLKETMNRVDFIILSPGIDIHKCKLSKFLKKNKKKIFSDLDIFYAFYKNDNITITGTNGKSTTCQLLYEIFSSQKIDVRLVGNIGNPILSTKKIKKKNDIYN